MKVLINLLKVSILLSVLYCPLYAQSATEPLLEVPLHSIPDGMTFEEYEAINFRVSTGLIRGVIPGGVHLYALEESTGWTLMTTASLGLITVIVGASLTKKNENINQNSIDLGDGNQYEKMPVLSSNT